MALSAAEKKLRQGGGWREVQRGQKTDEARREVEERELHDAPRRQKPPPPRTRPAPLVEVRPQMGCERHCGSGFELVLNVTVPQMCRELVEVPMITFVEQIVGISARGGPAPVVESISHAPTVFSLVVEYISPSSAVFEAPAPALEFLAPALAVSNRQRQSWNFSLPLQQCYKHQRHGGVSCTGVRGDLIASASGGFHLTHAGCCPVANASC